MNPATEVYGLPSAFQLANLASQKPRVLNGAVSVKRYRITVEEIEEPKEVLAGRLRALLQSKLHMDSQAAIRRYAEQFDIPL
ncbi:hypothetical protein [Paucibacter soli]|uniref:hypothetical protein n=1 Tax=Paucibacter soli TaxID=3133433 RepID=UPI0030A141AE